MKYQVIYAQPENHHLTLAQIHEIGDSIKSVAADDSILFMWADHARPESRMKLVMQDWGFEFIKELRWNLHIRDTVFRERVCLIGKRGNHLIMTKQDYDCDCPYPWHCDEYEGHYVTAELTTHVHPDKLIEDIEYLTTGPYLEVFSKVDRKGWTNWWYDNCIQIPTDTR